MKEPVRLKMTLPNTIFGASIVALPPPSNCKSTLAGKDEVVATVRVAPTKMETFVAAESDAEPEFVKERSKSTVVAVGRKIDPVFVKGLATLKVEHDVEDIVPLLVKVPSIVKVAVPEPTVMVPLLTRETEPRS